MLAPLPQQLIFMVLKFRDNPNPQRLVRRLSRASSMSQFIKIRVRYSQQSTPYQMEMSAKSPKLLQQNDQHYIHKYHMKENPYLRTKQREKVYNASFSLKSHFLEKPLLLM